VNRQRLIDGWLRTGDLFSRDKDGCYFFRGRTDDMFKSGGESVYPKEVENLLLTHPEVADVSVVPLAHPTKGEVPVAMVVLAKRASASVEDLKSFCLKNGPAYAHPRRILLVPELPLNGAAKTDRLEVKRRLVAEFGAEIGSAA
jgi:acyl-CoA synthetase (AMP-forming)/AMP-acid ligase II